MLTGFICLGIGLVFALGVWVNYRGARDRKQFIQETGLSEHDLWRFGDFKEKEGESRILAVVFIGLGICSLLGWIKIVL